MENRSHALIAGLFTVLLGLADVPFMVAVNKVDKAGANPDRVKQELSQQEVIPSDWGGSHEFVSVSALESPRPSASSPGSRCSCTPFALSPRHARWPSSWWRRRRRRSRG